METSKKEIIERIHRSCVEMNSILERMSSGTLSITTMPRYKTEFFAGLRDGLQAIIFEVTMRDFKSHQDVLDYIAQQAQRFPKDAFESKIKTSDNPREIGRLAIYARLHTYLQTEARSEPGMEEISNFLKKY